jgi:hypothetical protein
VKRHTTAITRFKGFAYGSFVGILIGVVVAVVFLFTADSVVSKATFGAIVFLVTLFCGAIGMAFPRTVKIVAIIVSMIPIP